MKTKKKGFTLVEMLIVIVIIGILAAALIPKLMSARGRANDVARKADLQQIMTAMISYQLDKGYFPLAEIGDVATGIVNIETQLVDAGLAQTPNDPAGSTSFSGLNNVFMDKGTYGYMTVTKNGQPRGGVVLMSKTETELGSNYVICPGDKINHTDDTSSINLCTKLTVGTCSKVACTYSKTGGNLRYIAIY